MKTFLPILLLTILSSLAVNNPGSIVLWGSYDETGYYRSEHVLTVGSNYEFSNLGTEVVSVVVMPGQNLTMIIPGQTVEFQAQGEWLLIFSPFEIGQNVKGLKLRKVL